MDIKSNPMINYLISRLKLSKKIDQIVLATTERNSDDILAEFVSNIGIDIYRGSENNVLDRFYKAAKKFEADIVIRITADCPLIDPYLIDKVIEDFNVNNEDYLSNALNPSFPDGLDCQIFSFDALKKSWKEAKLLSDREHVGTYIERTCPDKFKTGSLIKFKDLGHHRWTLDEPRDYTFLKEIFSRLWSEDKIFLTADILKLLDDSPELLNINKDIIRNQGYQRSLKNDKA